MLQCIFIVTQMTLKTFTPFPTEYIISLKGKIFLMSNIKESLWHSPPVPYLSVVWLFSFSLWSSSYIFFKILFAGPSALQTPGDSFC